MDMKDVNAMTQRGILQSARSERKLTQEVIANKTGMKRNAVSQSLNRPRISLEMFSRLLNAMDYDIVIVDRADGEAKWKLDTWTADELGIDL